MKRFLASLALAFALAGANAAYADSATGMIRGVNMADHTITLDNGQTYTIDSTVDVSKFKAGERVSINYALQNRKNMATEVVLAAA